MARSIFTHSMSLDMSDKENEINDSTNNNTEERTTSSVSSAVKESIAKNCSESNMNCGGTVSYIHVYNHSANCIEDSKNESHSSCKSSDKDKDIDIEIPSVSQMFNPIKSLLSNMHSAIPGNKETEELKEEHHSNKED